MFSKNHPIILFIDRNGFSVFQDTLPNIVRFTFTPDIVANLDVVNKEQFSSLIATFIQINKILPSSLALVLSDNIIYEKDIENALQKPAVSIEPLGLEVPGNIDKDHKEEIQNFLDDIPFEEVLAKVVKTGEGSRIIGVNNDLVMTIADAFTNRGSVLEGIIPSFLYGQRGNFTIGLTQENVEAILEESDIIKVGNLLTNQQKASSLEGLESERKDPSSGKEKNPQNFRQYILVGIFVTLLVILAVVYLNLGASQTPSGRKIKSSSVGAISIPTTPPPIGPTLVQLPTTTVPLDIKNIKVKIVQNSQSDTVASNLKSELLKIGFQDIGSEVSQASTPEKSSVIFSQNVPSEVRNSAIIEIKKVLPDISILENQDVNLTITILIGRS